MKFRKKPIIVDAIQWTGENIEEVKSFALGSTCEIIFNDDIYIDTLEGLMYVNINDWIIKGVKNELYPCKDDIFNITYELVEPSTELGSNQGTDKISTINYYVKEPHDPHAGNYGPDGKWFYTDDLKKNCVEDGCWWECVKCGANSTRPFNEHKVTYRGPVCDGVVIKRSSIRRTPIRDLGTLEFTDDLDD